MLIPCLSISIETIGLGVYVKIHIQANFTIYGDNPDWIKCREGDNLIGVILCEWTAGF